MICLYYCYLHNTPSHHPDDFGPRSSETVSPDCTAAYYTRYCSFGAGSIDRDCMLHREVHSEIMRISCQ